MKMIIICKLNIKDLIFSIKGISSLEKVFR